MDDNRWKTDDGWHLTPDTWHLTPDTWKLTPDTGHLTHDTWVTWHLTPDTWPLTPDIWQLTTEHPLCTPQNPPCTPHHSPLPPTVLTRGTGLYCVSLLSMAGPRLSLFLSSGPTCVRRGQEGWHLLIKGQWLGSSTSAHMRLRHFRDTVKVNQKWETTWLLGHKKTGETKSSEISSGWI